MDFSKFSAGNYRFRCWLYGRGKALKEGAPLIILLSLILGGGQMLLAPVNPTIACFMPFTAALAVVSMISKRRRYQHIWLIKQSPIMERKRREAETDLSMSFH